MTSGRAALFTQRPRFQEPGPPRHRAEAKGGEAQGPGGQGQLGTQLEPTGGVSDRAIRGGIVSIPELSPEAALAFVCDPLAGGRRRLPSGGKCLGLIAEGGNFSALKPSSS